MSLDYSDGVSRAASLWNVGVVGIGVGWGHASCLFQLVDVAIIIVFYSPGLFLSP